MINYIIQIPFFIKSYPNMNEEEKKLQRICDLINTETKKIFLFLPYTMQIFFFTEKEPLNEKMESRIDQKTKKRLFKKHRYSD